MSASRLSIDSAYELLETTVTSEPANMPRNKRKQSNSQEFLADLLISKQEKLSRPLLKANKDFYVPHADCTSTKDTKQVAKVVHDLVLEKYEKKHKILLDKLQKNNFSEEDKKYIDVVSHLKESFKAINGGDDAKGLLNDVSMSENLVVSSSKTFDLKIIQEKESVQVESHYETMYFHKRASTSTYNEARILDEHETSSQAQDIYVEPTGSLSSSDISYLLSMSSDTINNRSGKLKPSTNAEGDTDSLYNVVQIKNDESYERITNLYKDIRIRQDRIRIKQEIYVQENTVEQLYGLLRYGRKKMYGFIGTPEHLETERMLALTNAKIRVFTEFLHSEKPTADQTMADVTVGNLKCITDQDDPYNYSSQTYYVLILWCQDTIYATNIIKPNRLGWIDFNGPYTFHKLTSTFGIKMELYRLQINTPVSKTCGNLFKHKLPKAPMMKLVGERIIDQPKASIGSFMYNNGEESSINLTASVRINIQWPEERRGFLTIGTEKPGQQVLWNRRWCVLKKYNISSFTYPCEEEFGQTLGTISLMDCVSCDKINNLYPKKKSLVLKMKNGKSEKTIYATPDTEEELKQWKEWVDLVMKTLVDWHMTDVDQYTS